MIATKNEILQALTILKKQRLERALSESNVKNYMDNATAIVTYHDMIEKYSNG